MPTFDDTVGGTVSAILLDCISKAEGTDGLWWVAEEHADGTNTPRGIFVGRAQADLLADELAARHGVEIKVKSFIS
jgi:hypothetical protein